MIHTGIHGKASEYEANLRLAGAKGARFVGLLGDTVMDSDTPEAAFGGFIEHSIRLIAQATPLLFSRAPLAG